MTETHRFLEAAGLPSRDPGELPASSKRFPDGAQYRIEIPSVEGPGAFEAVLAAAKEFDVRIHRISQGSGIMLLTGDEIREMALLGRDHRMEVSLFVGPRATFDLGAQAVAPGGKSIGQRLRGADQLAYAIEEVRRACALGIRSVLVADEGLLWAVGRMRQGGELPPNLVVKVSVVMAPANPASARLFQELGANTLNIPTDLSLAQVASIRAAVDVPLDVYVEAPDGLGGFLRYYEIPDLIRVASPVYIKFGLRNAPDVYPSGTHLEAAVRALSRERVRRARLGLEMIDRYCPGASTSAEGPPDLGIPEG